MSIPRSIEAAVPDLRAALAADAPLEYVQGDKDMVKAASNFMREWLVRKNIEKALESAAPESLACVILYRADDVPAPSTPAEARAAQDGYGERGGGDRLGEAS